VQHLLVQADITLAVAVAVLMLGQVQLVVLAVAEMLE
jgi:hypothetical protein